MAGPLHHFTFSFDDLPLVIRDGINAGLIAGEAEIAYRSVDDFTVGTISLDGFRGRESKQVALADDEPLSVSIRQQLEGPCVQKLYDAIEDEINERAEAEADDAADHRLSLRREYA